MIVPYRINRDGSRLPQMSYNMLIWRWSDEYSDKNRRRRERLTHGGVASEFMRSGDHQALARFDQESFLNEINTSFPGDESEKPFIVERYPKGIIFNYSGAVRLKIVPVIGGVAMKQGLNATEA